MNTQLPKKYGSREEEIRAELTLEEVIARIKNYKFAEYDPDRPNFDAWDQLLACESLAESTPIKQREYTNENASVNGMINGSCKHRVSFELTQSKHKVIAELSQCNYRTPPMRIAKLLEELFKEWESKPGHWLYVAQHWNPREINRNINRLIKIHSTGRETIKNAAAYFTYLIRFRKERKNL